MGETRTALVTGASSGIGRAIAVACGAQGWQVAIGARRVAQLEETADLVRGAGGEPFARALDVRDPASIDAFLAECPPVDVLVNNAGIAQPGALHEAGDEIHRRILETNLLGAMLLTKRIVGALRHAGSAGDVVFISSDITQHPRPHLPAYAVSKAGLEALAHVLALECEGTGIRSTVVRVGPTLSGFGDGWDLAIFESLFPLWRRFGIQRHFNTMQPEDVGRAVITAVTAPSHMWMPIIEVQPAPPRDVAP